MLPFISILYDPRHLYSRSDPSLLRPPRQFHPYPHSILIIFVLLIFLVPSLSVSSSSSYPSSLSPYLRPPHRQPHPRRIISPTSSHAYQLRPPSSSF